MNNQEWNRVANISGIISLISIPLFLWRLMSGSIGFLTITFFSLVIVGVAAYLAIKLILVIRKSTPEPYSVSHLVSGTREFVYFFISMFALLLFGIGFAFFSSSAAGRTGGSLLMLYFVIEAGFKVYDVQRLTTHRTAHITLSNDYKLRSFSRAEQIGLGMMGLGFILMFFIPACSIIIFIGGLIFLIRPLAKHMVGQIIDQLLLLLNCVMIAVSILLVIFK